MRMRRDKWGVSTVDYLRLIPGGRTDPWKNLGPCRRCGLDVDMLDHLWSGGGVGHPACRVPEADEANLVEHFIQRAVPTLRSEPILRPAFLRGWKAIEKFGPGLHGIRLFLAEVEPALERTDGAYARILVTKRTELVLACRSVRLVTRRLL